VKDIAQSSPYVKFQYWGIKCQRSIVINVTEVAFKSNIAFGTEVSFYPLSLMSYISRYSSINVIFRGENQYIYSLSVLIIEVIK